MSRLSIRKSYVGKREKDNSKTPSDFYNFIVNELGFVDVCLNPKQFNFFSELPEKSYCNPPFSRKSEFIYHACREARKGKVIVMLLPADFSTQWFINAYYNCKASVIIVAGSRIHSKRAIFPSILLIFNNKQEVHIVKYNELKQFLRKYLTNRN